MNYKQWDNKKNMYERTIIAFIVFFVDFEPVVS